VPPERVAELAERHGVDREALAGLVKRVTPSWASKEQGWRAARDPALPEFQGGGSQVARRVGGAAPRDAIDDLPDPRVPIP
jgi:hypothetical protein